MKLLHALRNLLRDRRGVHTLEVVCVSAIYFPLTFAIVEVGFILWTQNAMQSAATIAALDAGTLRVAEKQGNEWVVHAWVKQAILLYFAVRPMEALDAGPLHFHDKIPLKGDLAKAGVRVVPPGAVRYGAHVEAGAVVMPAYVNIGARVGAGTMVDTWATVGSCAQIGKHVHLSGGVGIGGVLEPASARPVIVEDGAFLGSRAIVVEGEVRVVRHFPGVPVGVDEDG